MRSDKGSMVIRTYSRIGDVAILDRNVEVDTNQDTLSCKIEISDGKLAGERHDEQLEGLYTAKPDT